MKIQKIRAASTAAHKSTTNLTNDSSPDGSANRGHCVACGCELNRHARVVYVFLAFQRTTSVPVTSRRRLCGPCGSRYRRGGKQRQAVDAAIQAAFPCTEGGL